MYEGTVAGLEADNVHDGNVIIMYVCIYIYIYVCIHTSEITLNIHR
jgi:hypothetical protein